MIKLNDISYEYPRSAGKAINGLTLTLDRGELCSVIGANGSGKTTLLRLLARSVLPSSGDIEIDGRNAAHIPQKEYARYVSRMTQEHQVPPVYVSDLVASGRYPYLGFSGRLTEADEKAVQRAVSAMGIEPLLDKKLTMLSGGQRQRVFLALLLAQDTPYVLLDEPSNHLDLSSTLETYRVMISLRDGGKGVMAVSHDLSAALKYSDKLVLLDGGRTVFVGTPWDLLSSGIIESTLSVRCVEFDDGGEKEYVFKKI